MVPKDHLVRAVEAAIDFDFIYEHTKMHYSPNRGRPCLDPVILFKIVLLNFLFGKNSIRATIEETKVNVTYRWFLGLGLTEQVPHYSTFSQNFIRRYKDTPIFDTIFQTVLEVIISKGLVDTSVIFVDGTHVKANANKYKRIKK